jgi:hypothetical protein
MSVIIITTVINSGRYTVIAELMSIFQPSLKNLEKAKERRLGQNENGDDSNKRVELDKILKEGLSRNSFKKDR